MGSGSISRSYDPAGHRDEHEHTHILSTGQEDPSSDSPVIPSLPASHPPSQYAGYCPPSQYSHHPPSGDSYRSAPHLSSPSVAGSITSRVHRASRPATRVRGPPPRNTSRCRGGCHLCICVNTKTFYLGSSQFRNTRSLQKTMLMKFPLHQSWPHGVLPRRRPKLLGKETLLRRANTLHVLEVELYNNMLCDGRNTSGPRLVVKGKHARQHFHTWIQLTW